MKRFFNKNKLFVFLSIVNIICYSEVFSELLFITKVDTKEKIVFLTFDDGPGHWTKNVLNVLKKYDVKATFFVLGELVKYRENLVKQVHISGHEIGIHLFTHKNFYQMQKKYSLEDIKKFLVQEIEESIKQIDETLGIKPKYLRMPHGFYRSWMDEILQKYDLKVINWSFGCDWTNLSSEEMIKEYCSNLQRGGIYLFHDGGKKQNKNSDCCRKFYKICFGERIQVWRIEKFCEIKICRWRELNPHIRWGQ